MSHFCNLTPWKTEIGKTWFEATLRKNLQDPILMEKIWAWWYVPGMFQQWLEIK
jgi:hypothetical protein